MPIDMPTRPGFVFCEFGLETNTQRFESPLTKNVQRVKLGGDFWTATYTLPRMNREMAAEWQAFFLKLEGGVNTFNAFDPDARRLRGNGTGIPLVLGGGQQFGNYLITDGWMPGQQKAIRAGDYFSVNGELKMAVEDKDADGGGAITLHFRPAMRSIPADNAPITIERAGCPMILVDDMQAKWRCDRNGIYEEKTFSAREVF